VPRFRSRARAGTPAARAARAVTDPAGEVPRDHALSTSVKIGQAVVFLAALGLLALYTVSDQLARDEGFHVRINWVSLALLGVAAFVVVLPRVTRARPADDGVEVDLAGRAHDAALTAATVALGRGAAALPPGEPSPALARASVDPLTSIELSRRVLAAELRRLAAAAGIPATAPSLVGFADRLYGARWLSAAEASAIGELAAVIDVAKASGSVAPAVAQDVDDATQLLIPVLDGRLDEAAARYERSRGTAADRPGRAGVDVGSAPYNELDAIEVTEDLDDAVEDLEDAVEAPPEPGEGSAMPAAEGPDDPAGGPGDEVEAPGDDVAGSDDDLEIDLREGAPTVAGAERGTEPRALESPVPESVAWRSTT
jgi:hypothetical protein